MLVRVTTFSRVWWFNVERLEWHGYSGKLTDIALRYILWWLLVNWERWLPSFVVLGRGQRDSTRITWEWVMISKMTLWYLARLWCAEDAWSHEVEYGSSTGRFQLSSSVVHKCHLEGSRCHEIISIITIPRLVLVISISLSSTKYYNTRRLSWLADRRSSKNHFAHDNGWCPTISRNFSILTINSQIRLNIVALTSDNIYCPNQIHLVNNTQGVNFSAIWQPRPRHGWDHGRVIGTNRWTEWE
jgi:hypothetical protein